jgi:PleD family two-component response regulator
MKGCIVTCSAGISERRQNVPFADFLRRSDESLYSAKSSGRDRTGCLERA